ncbi:MAG: Gfo/Idh/MocA family oxidoreductase [Ignavibacteriae bacterium]|nr:Gfo/Idh/MocA family oxidoreductase [Ignavibacteriota bacterium]
MKKLNWGILGTAAIAKNQIIPAILKSKYCNLTAIASRNINDAKKLSTKFGVPKYYGSYEELLADKEINAVYIPLPNHLHVTYAIKSLEYGKNVLVEKPIALNFKEVKLLIKKARKFPDLKIMEAFMYRFHPQWIKTKKIIQKGEIGKLKLIQSSFSFFDDNENSIVNKKEYGGGSLMDIGCYSVSLSNYIFENLPKSIFATNEIHPKFNVDISTTCILEYKNGISTFFSSIQLNENQNVKIFGTKGIIEFELPFNPNNDKVSNIWLTKNNIKEKIEFDICDQYKIQIDQFSEAVLKNKILPITLEDSLNNMIVIDKIIESAKSGKRILL